MAEEQRKKEADSKSSPVEDFVQHLSEEQRILVILKSQLYGGNWDLMLGDLQNRLEGKPYIFKLVNRIQDDIERIKQMRRFEQEHGVDLAEYVHLDETAPEE
ncbi:MAG TPA: hypothetical protein PLP49_09785 [Anaerohalosphaeraceae bacterium]|jgi:hypothetical protein|nr:hypothetical protein [Anaerohalosphaeraceae bacterium]HPB93777.1 hypothetical protein [Anaerohalosphaeraceae bacterium]HRT24188.1 hypothetical protein [Anaerohalosphaeraceae bacterium]HRU15831.1 hypothetical protein [Anaerohalosphaeraceae bacterium]